MAKITLDPINRIEGHLKIEVEIDGTNTVTAAYATGTMFRGFENILIGRDPRDAIHITQRICGVCPVPHATAAVEALEQAFGVTISQNARTIRNLVHGTDFISDHIFHFYHLALLDYIKGPALPPFTPGNSVDYRFSSTDNQLFVNHYVQALEMRRIAQEMGALFAGKIPHIMSYAPGGVTQVPDGTKISEFRTYLFKLISFIQDIYIPDVQKLAITYNDYKTIGKGPGNLIAYGGLPLDAQGTKFFKRGKYTNGSVSTLDTSGISEQVKYSWYADTDTNKHPSLGTTTPNMDKVGAYTWLKAPRLNGQVYELGPLARMIINGDYTGGISVMDRHLARAYEAKKVANAMLLWLDSVTLDASGYKHITQMPANGKGEGLTEATRGGLGHWFEYTSGKLTKYQVITPTCWNASPQDDTGKPGAIEQALVGVKVADINQPIELFRIIRSFDPCMGCAVHVTNLEKEQVKVINI